MESSRTAEARVPAEDQMPVAGGGGNGSDTAVADDDMARLVLRKIDRNLIPVLFVTYMFNFMDKTILSSAAVFGLREDNGLQGQDYSWVSAIFYFGYFAWEYPTTLLIARLPVARYLTANTLFWGAVVALTAACHSYGGLLAVRFLLGVAEATITPAFMFITSTWYTRDEIPTRTGIWFSGNSVGGLVASLLAFGIGHIPRDGAVGPWRAMYVVLGLATFLWAFAVWRFLPDSIATARFLSTPAERRFAVDRVVVAGTGRTDGTSWRWAQVRECLADPKTWFFFCLGVASQIPNGGTQNFANLVVHSFGFTALQTTLVNIPYSLLAAAWIAGTGWLAGRHRTANCLLIVAVVLPCIAGASVIYASILRRGGTTPTQFSFPRGVLMFAYFLLASGSAAMPLAMSLVQANYRGVTKKMTVSALLFVAYCAGNIAGPQFFRADEERSGYGTAFAAITACYSLVAGLALGLRAYLQLANRRRAREEGFVGSAGAAGPSKAARAGAGGGGEDGTRDGAGRTVAQMVGEVELRAEDYEDVTDWEMVGFRYRL
ncbi:hypothetical protein RB599_008684 [Gaeumannomyces hyphopodioides]